MGRDDPPAPDKKRDTEAVVSLQYAKITRKERLGFDWSNVHSVLCWNHCLDRDGAMLVSGCYYGATTCL